MPSSTFDRCLTIVALATGLALGACGHSSAYDPEHPESPAARAESVEAAVADIVDARCALEDRCGHVGADQKYESRDTCASKLQGTTASEINTNDCPFGVNGRKLETCLANIKAEECGSVFDTMGRWNACRNGQVCYSRSTRVP